MDFYEIHKGDRYQIRDKEYKITEIFVGSVSKTPPFTSTTVIFFMNVNNPNDNFPENLQEVLTHSDFKRLPPKQLCEDPTVCECGHRHPLVAELGVCGACADKLGWDIP